ncbi:MAG: substrate-binding domain-containing protein [Burkholderiales bacterium]|nr:substrate-binding domain-containing protein [Burkholderiales bacterium]
MALRAGVSLATASRCINHPAKVNPEFRERVTRAVQELAYVTNGRARALATSRSHSIGAIVPTLNISIFATAAELLQRRLGEAGYTLMLANSAYDPVQELAQVKAFLEQGIDGVVLVGAEHDPKVFELLQSSRTPFILTYTYAADSQYPCVGFDNYRAAYRLTEYVIGLGHRRFGLIMSPTSWNDRVSQRLAAIRAALADHSILELTEYVLDVSYSISKGRSAFRRLMTGAKPPTAVMCTNDVFGVGALLECRALGIEVPRRVSIVGFDDLELAAEIEPGLTTCQIPIQEMTDRVVDYLLSSIAGRTIPQAVELATKIIIRGSTGRPG